MKLFHISKCFGKKKAKMSYLKYAEKHEEC